MFGSHRRTALMAGLVAVPLLVGCTSSGNGSPAAQAPVSSVSSTVSGSTTVPAAPVTTPSKTPAAPAAQLVASPADGSTKVNPKAPVQLKVSGGTLASVTFTNKAGKKVEGALDAAKTSWHATETLGYGKTYTIKSVARNAEGKSVTKSSSFTTLTPDNMTMPYFDTTLGSAMDDGATYGVGMVVNLHFDEPITDRKAAEKALVVTTSPAVTGSWYWESDQNVHWRPRNYYAPGTRVTVHADVFGKNLGKGLYGQADKSISFKIGARHVSIADDNTHQVKVYFGNKLVRTMPTSMGKGGVQYVNGRRITYWTQRGTYTVIDHNNPKIMDSRSYGLPLDKGGYKEAIYWATRISTDGVFLHELKSTIPDQGHRDVSHGCLNLNTANSKWFYKNSIVGDVVTVKNTGGSPLEVWQNGDWSLSWASWQAGSALH